MNAYRRPGRERRTLAQVAKTPWHHLRRRARWYLRRAAKALPRRNVAAWVAGLRYRAEQRRDRLQARRSGFPSYEALMAARRENPDLELRSR